LDVKLKKADIKTNTFEYEGKTFHSPYEGLYSMYNCAAVFGAAKLLGISNDAAEKVFANAPQPAGRNEHFEKDGKRIILNLVKNPTGANEVMKVIDQDDSDKAVVIVLNDREQDGTDVSWIYDTHFEKILKPETKAVFCTGLRAWDMALRLYYEGWQGPLECADNLESALAKAKEGADTIYVIATYTALAPSRAVIVKEVQG
jgi:UDP-N-acetylmuramyl tripeptide synthase